MQVKFKTSFDTRIIPNDNLIVYHYCNDIVFNSICQNQEIWLSDIYSMNDSSEFHWGRESFSKVLKENKYEFNQDFRYYIIFKVMSSQPNALPLIACFSKNGDLLSQWRAYADDGKGFSIGFNSHNIYYDLGVNFNSVVYEEELQYTLILNTIRALHSMWKSNNEDFDSIELLSKAFSIDLAYFKNPTFFEEQEIRILRLLVKEKNSFIDIGGNSDTNEIKPLSVLNRRKNNDDIKYIKLPIKNKTKNLISEIILGPKNKSSIPKVEKFLNELGINNVSVKKSKSTYR